MIAVHGIRSGRCAPTGKHVIVIKEGHMLYPPYPFTDNTTVNKERYYNYFTKKLAHKKEVRDWLDEKANLYMELGHLEIWGPHAGEKTAGKNETNWLYIIEAEIVKLIREKRKKQYNRR